MNQSDLDKLNALRAKAEMPPLEFDPKNIGQSFRSSYGLVADIGISGVNVDCLPFGGRSDLTDEEEIAMMSARAEYVALACNIAPALAEANAAMIAAMRDAIERAIEAQEGWADVELPYAPEWVYPFRQIANLLTNAVAQAEGEK